MPRWSLLFLRATLALLPCALSFAAWATHAPTKPDACGLLLELRFDRPFAAPVVRDWRAEGLKVDFATLTLVPNAEPLIHRILSELDAAKLKASLAVTPASDQTAALDLTFEIADHAFLAKDARVSARFVLAAALARGPGNLKHLVEATAAELPVADLHARARRAYAERGAPLAHELRRRVVAGTLRLTVEDGFETIAFDCVIGAPDRATYEFAKQLTDASALVRVMPARDRRLALALIAARTHALERAWNTDHYAQLERITYTEPVTNGYVDRPIKDFIVDKRFLHPHWWEDQATFAGLMDQAEGRPPGERTRITGQTSRSPLAYLFGRDAERRIYWPAVREGKTIRPDLSRMSLNETLVDGRSEAVELLVNERPGTCPQAYYFLTMAGDLVPTLKFNRRPITQACAGCHAKERGDQRLTFNPFFLKTARDLHQVGYRNDTLIEALRTRDEPKAEDAAEDSAKHSAEGGG